MSTAYKHWAVKTSWWNGRVTTACGLEFEEATRASWFTAKCPACEQARKRQGR